MLVCPYVCVLLATTVYGNGRRMLLLGVRDPVSKGRYYETWAQ